MILGWVWWKSPSFEHSARFEPGVLAFRSCGVGMDMMLITLLIFGLCAPERQILLYFQFEDLFR
jgi:hypothetical protein